jgi:prepilin-type N-terminal cleavage/methylation domain-containing protein
MRKQKQSGFTIVELLIVIVVIGILAALVLNTFSGAQAKARNAQAASTVRTYKAALMQYAVDYGKYPGNSTTSGCLGEGYGYGCWPAGNSDTFNDAIRPYMSNADPLPRANDNPIEYFGTRSGAAFHYSTGYTLNGNPNPWTIVYFLEGAEPCPVGPVAGYSSGWQSMTLPAGRDYTERYQGKNTMCVIPMPDPTKL